MFDPDLVVRRGAYLPHWTREGAIYHVCFRLADSLSQNMLDDLRFEREALDEADASDNIQLSEHDKRRQRHLHSQKIEKLLDAGYGDCWLRDTRIAELVVNALKYFDSERYTLHAWCIMPNHVHIVVQPHEGEKLEKIVRSWKSFTAKEANKILNRTGPFWQREYFDHLIRNPEFLERTIRYVWNNPEKAGIKNWQWRWKSDQ